MSSLWRKWWFYLIGVVVLLLIVFTVFYGSSSTDTEVTLSQFLADVQAGRVTRIEVDGRTVDYRIDGADVTQTTELERGDTVRDVLADAGIQPGSPEYPTIVTDDVGGFVTVVRLFLNFLPIVIIVGILFFFLRQASSAQRRWPWSMAVSNFDPVCRMTVNPGSAAGTSTFMGTTYYFCSPEHKAQFDADPARYLLQK